MAADLTSWELMDRNEVGYLMEHEDWDGAYEYFLRKKEYCKNVLLLSM